MDNTYLEGTGVAIVTPFHKQKSIDFTALGNIVEHTINNNVNYLVIIGTTAETPTLNAEEMFAIRDFMVNNVDGRVPIVLGFSGNNTMGITDELFKVDLTGISSILSCAPYYNRPTQRGIYEHFKNLVEASNVPIILYNVPSRTSSNISVDTCLKLAYDFPNIIGIKEASGNISQCMDIIANKPKDFYVISGDDALTLPLMSFGASGVISVSANAFPKEISQMVNFCLKGDFVSAKKIHYKMLPFSKAIFEEGNPSGIKAALEIMGMCKNYLRLPLTQVDKSLYKKIETIINGIENENKTN
ncbi:MAG: 4-hydroxy-tetrahydrodipicolinate synthase [Bacteroidales bacterium]|jgi:4-hydroxy-tetrahydrodipicolinate synthase|nr:4-hydroxy-tetrahydrodipicolinate synthase [Bacteroidales bacterium]